MVKKSILGAILILLPLVNIAQQIGLANSNYSTTNAVLLNPSKSSDPKMNFDMTLLGFNFFAKNNYALIPKDNFKLSEIANAQPIEDFIEEKKYGFHLELDVMLPSFSKAINEYGFGTFVRARAMVNGNNMPSHLMRFFWWGFGYKDQHDNSYQAGDFMIKSMSWLEVGANASRIAYQFNNHQVTAGVNIKRLFGIHNAGMYFSDSDYKVSNDSINIYLLNGNFGYAMPNEAGELPGKGWGMDIGFTYKRTIKPVNRYIPFNKFSSCEQRRYDYKIGVSFLDIGGIKFKNNAVNRTFDNSSTVWRDYRTTELTSLEGFEDEITTRFGDELTSVNEFRAALPTSIVLEIDKRFRNFFYLNTTGLLNIRRRSNLGVSRLGFFALTPRFEFNKFEAAFPITLYGYNPPSLGFMLKGGGFFIGSNNFIPFVLNMNVWGADIYMGFKYSIASNKSCKPVVEERKNWWCPSCENDKKKKRR